MPEELRGEPACRELVRADVDARPNLVIVLNDTMRRDALGVYGGLASTPQLDAFAREHLLFESAFTQAPWTKPAIASLFTSLYPSQHHVASDPQLRLEEDERSDDVIEADVLSKEFETMAEVLRDAGYRTAAFMSNPWMESRFGFDQGFEVYDDSFASWGYKGKDVVEAGLDWIEGLADDEPYFLYLHLIDSHRPYGKLSIEGVDARRRRFNKSQRITGKEASAITQMIRMEDGAPAEHAGFAPTRALVRAAYLAGVEQFDSAFGALLARLVEHPRWGETALIVTSDHGEALYDRGYGNHGGGLYDDEAAIPLIARLPGLEVETKSVGCVTGLVDVLPSLCSYLDLTCPGAVRGWSFIAKPDEPASDERRYLATEGVMNRPDHRSVRNRSYKILYEPGGSRGEPDKTTAWTLFDLRVDDKERFDRTNPDRFTPESKQAYLHLKKSLETAVAERAAPRRETVPIDRDLERRLKALGYGE